MNAGRVLILVALALLALIAIDEDDPPALGFLGLLVTTLLICYGACR